MSDTAEQATQTGESNTNEQEVFQTNDTQSSNPGPAQYLNLTRAQNINSTNILSTSPVSPHIIRVIILLAMGSRLRGQLNELIPERTPRRHTQDVLSEHLRNQYLDSLPVVDFDELDEADRHCGICFDKYVNPERIVNGSKTEEDGADGESRELPIKLPCGHVLGDLCYERWLHSSTKCPICRRSAMESMSSSALRNLELLRSNHQHDIFQDIGTRALREVREESQRILDALDAARIVTVDLTEWEAALRTADALDLG